MEVEKNEATWTRWKTARVLYNGSDKLKDRLSIDTDLPPGTEVVVQLRCNGITSPGVARRVNSHYLYFGERLDGWTALQPQPNGKGGVDATNYEYRFYRTAVEALGGVDEGLPPIDVRTVQMFYYDGHTYADRREANKARAVSILKLRFALSAASIELVLKNAKLLSALLEDLE